MEIDTRPVATDISLCTNKFCSKKCKRYYEFWKPNTLQSYIHPANEYDKEGNQRPCKLRMK